MILLVGPKGQRIIPENTEYRLLPGEVNMGSANGMEDWTELKELANDNKVGLGQLVSKVFESTGFKKWYFEKHGGDCLACHKRQYVLDYIRFKSPKWLSDWVKGMK